MLILLSLEIVKIQKYVFQQAGHVLTGNLKMISDSKIRVIVSKGPKYRFPSYIDFDKWEEIASALNVFGKREGHALKEWSKKYLYCCG